MFKGKTFQIQEKKPLGTTFDIKPPETDVSPMGKTFQIKESWVDEHIKVGGQVLSAAPSEWKPSPWTSREIVENYKTGTEFLQRKYPEKIDPIEYIRKGLTFGHAPNLPIVPAATTKQKAMETAGFILGATLLRSVTFPLVGAVASKIPTLAKPLATLTKTMQAHPWKAGYPISTAIAGTWGAFLGAIEKAETKEEWARNVVVRSGTFAAFNVLAYPIIQFFRPVVYEVAKNTKYWKDPNIKNMLGSPGMQTIYRPPQTLYFRHPTDPKLILKVTQKDISVLPFSQAPKPANTYPILAERQVEIFKYDPSLYSKLKGFLAGKFVSHPIKPPPKGADPLLLNTQIVPPPIKPTPPTVKPPVAVPPAPEVIITPPSVKVPTTPKELGQPAEKGIIPKIEKTTTGFTEDIILRKQMAKEGYGNWSVFTDKDIAIQEAQKQFGNNFRLVKHISTPETGSKVTYEIYAKGVEDIFAKKEVAKGITPKELEPLALREMSLPQQKLVYQRFLKEGNKDTFEGFLKQFRLSTFDPKTGKPSEVYWGLSPEELAKPAVKGVEPGIPTDMLHREPDIPKITIPKGDTPKPMVKPTELASKADLDKLVHNQKYDLVREKMDTLGKQALTPDEIDVLRAGKHQAITGDEEAPIKELESEDIVHQKMEELYSGVPLNKIAENILITFKGSKVPILDAFGSTLIRYYGLTPETKDLLIKLEGQDALKREDLLKLFEQEFPITTEQAKLLTNYQENPAEHPIPPELQPFADKVASLVDASKKIQEDKGMMEEFFPQSFIRRSNAKITEHKETMAKLVRPDAISRHKKAIEELEEYIKFLEGLRYVPHAYLASERIQQNILKLLPEGKISSWFRDRLTKLRGRKIATLDDAKEMGLLPEEDIRVLLASHFDYLYRKVAIHDMMEAFKKNRTAVLPDKEAPDDWQKVAVSQLDGYRVNPFLVGAMEDFTVNPGTSIMDLVLKPYDAINHLGRAIFFYNPIIMPLWNMFQAYGAGTVTPWKPIYSTKLIGQAIKDVTKKTQLYRDAVERKLYDPMEVGRFSPSIEEAMKVIINKTDEKYPGWKKAIEKITGRPVNWQTFAVIPELYKTNWRFTWIIDRIQRTATLRHALNMGMDIDTAVKYTNKFHADYNIFAKKARPWLYRAFLVPTYKANMLINLPSYIGKNAIEVAKAIPKGQTGTPEQKAAASAIFRIGLFFAALLSFAAWRGYRFREGYRLVKKIAPEITPEGKVVSERVITLPGPYMEWFKVAGRAEQQKFDGIFMYLAKVPQIIWSVARNRRWQGDEYYNEGAAPETQRKQIMISILKDYVAPIGQYDIMTREEQDAFDNIMGLFGMATYKRGATENRIMWEINDQKNKLKKYLEKPDVSWEDKQKAIDYYESFVEGKIKELEALIE